MADHVERDARPGAGLPHRADVGVLAGGVAEQECARGPRGEGGAGTEALQVDEVEQHSYPLLGDAVLEDEAVAARVVDGHVPEDARRAGRSLLPGRPSVTNVDRRHAGEAEDGRHRLEMVLAVDQVGSGPERLQVVDHGDGRGAQLARHVAQLRAVGDRRVSACEEGGCQIAHVELGAGAHCEAVVGDQDA